MTRSGADRPLRVLLVIGTLEVGGTETQVAALAAGLRRRGHDVRVLVLYHTGPLEPVLRAAGVPFQIFHMRDLGFRTARRRWPRLPLWELCRLLGLCRDIRRFRPDVCHAFLFVSYSVVLPLARAAAVPVRISGRRGASPPVPTGLRRRILDTLGHRATTAYVCNSRAGAADLVRDEGVPRGKIQVVPNGVRLPERLAEVTRQPPRGVVVANLIRYKGHADLVAALALLPDPPRMFLAGDGPERERIAALLAGHGLADRVELAGRITGAQRLLPGFQFAVLPSHHEGSPNAVLEAMAAGLPVIATAVGGVPELLRDGVTGLLVPPHSPGELAKAIARLAADPRLRARIGAAARRAAEDFGMDRCVARHETLYRTLLP